MIASQDHLDAALMAFVLTVAIVDWRTHRIPNLLCSVAALVGIALQTWLHGEAGLLSALGGAAVGFAMFLPFYVVRAFGAGDVKAMATAGIFLGLGTTLLAVGMTLIAGALLGILLMMHQAAPTSATRYRLLALLTAPVASMRASRRDPARQASHRFPYGVAIACGTTAALLIMNR